MEEIKEEYIRDIVGSHMLHLYCDRCGHYKDVDAKELPGDVRLSELRSRLRCAECGSKECGFRTIYNQLFKFDNA